jgi:hypothetical protein
MSWFRSSGRIVIGGRKAGRLLGFQQSQSRCSTVDDFVAVVALRIHKPQQLSTSWPQLLQSNTARILKIP